MAFALFVNADGNLEQLNVGDTLNVDIIEPAGTGNLVIGATLGVGDELQLGQGTSGTGDVRVLSDLYVDNDLFVTGSATVTVDETVTGTFNAEGDVNLGTGNGDAIVLGGGGTDTVTLSNNLNVGDNLISIGTGADDSLADLWLQTINTAGTGVSLRGTGDGTSGSEAIGVYTGGLTISPATDDLQTVIEALDAAISAGGGESLQQTYQIGNTIAVSTTYGALQFSNSADTTNVLELSRTFAGAGSALTVSMGATTTGIGVDLDSVAGATGTLLDLTNAGDGVGFLLNNTGAGNALQVQDGGTDVLVVDSAGAVDITPTSGQSLTMTVAGAGTVDITSDTGDITIDATAAELYLDDVGSWGGTLSQTGDRTLSQTGAGEVLNGATSLIGAINRIADQIEDVGIEQFVEYPIESGVTLAPGDCVARGATAGRVQQADADGTAEQKKFVGTCRTGGTGDAGGTVTATVWTDGALCTGTGFTAGSPLFVPTTPGDPVTTAPTGTGDLLQRVGWALSTTEYILDPGPPVIL
jgi:hypothetical protein